MDVTFDEAADLVEWVQYFWISMPLTSIKILHRLRIVSLLIA